MPLRLRYYIDECKHRAGDIAYWFSSLFGMDRDPYSQRQFGRAPGRFRAVTGRGGLIARLLGGSLVIVGAALAFLVLTASRGGETVDVGTTSAADILDAAEAAAVSEAGVELASFAQPAIIDDAPEPASDARARSGSPKPAALPSDTSSWSPQSQPAGDLPAVWVLPLDVTAEEAAARPHLRYAAWDNETAVGTELVAMTAALVTQTSDDEGTCGGLVRLAALDRGIEILYCHLSEVSVNEGDIIAAGTLVGLSGGEPGAPGSGSSDGEHLHLELRVNDELRCPQKLIARLVDASDGELSDLEADVAGLARWECIVSNPDDSASELAAGSTGAASVSTSHALSRQHTSDCGESLGFRTTCD